MRTFRESSPGARAILPALLLTTFVILAGLDVIVAPWWLVTAAYLAIVVGALIPRRRSTGADAGNTATPVVSPRPVDVERTPSPFDVTCATYADQHNALVIKAPLPTDHAIARPITMVVH